ncbi:hypothetical protein GCM10007967_18720 [Xylanimonas ulmi]
MVAESTPDVRSVVRLTGAPGLAAFGGTAHTRADREQFRLTLAMSRLNGLTVAHAHHTAVAVLRPGDNFGRPRRCVRLLIMLAGAATLSAGGRSVRIETGGGALLHGWEEYLYESTGNVTRVHLDVDVEGTAFADALHDVPTLAWRANCPVLHAAGAAFAEIVRRDERGISPAARSSLEHLAQAVLLSVLAFPPSGGVPAPVQRRSRVRVLEHIATRHSDPDLCPATVAAELGMSTRSLQRLFAGSDQSVAEHITAARLKHALALLADPHLIDMSLDRIACRTGFGSLARMRRVVHTATGLSPTEYRRQRLAPDDDLGVGPGRTRAATPASGQGRGHISPL